MRRIGIKGMFLVIGLSIMASGATVFAAAGDSNDRVTVNGASIETRSTGSAQPTVLVQRDDIAQQGELTQDYERPMSVPDDSRSESAMPGRTPGCGPWKNAINHMHCGSGYDVY